MLKWTFPAVALLASCAPVSSDAVYQRAPDLTMASAKPARSFAFCVANALPEAGAPLNDGEHYWINRQYGGAVIERWDFLPAPGGSVAYRRSGTITKNYGAERVKRCAA